MLRLFFCASVALAALESRLSVLVHRVKGGFSLRFANVLTAKAADATIEEIYAGLPTELIRMAKLAHDPTFIWRELLREVTNFGRLVEGPFLARDKVADFKAARRGLREVLYAKAFKLERICSEISAVNNKGGDQWGQTIAGHSEKLDTLIVAISNISPDPKIRRLKRSQVQEAFDEYVGMLPLITSAIGKMVIDPIRDTLASFDKSIDLIILAHNRVSVKMIEILSYRGEFTESRMQSVGAMFLIIDILIRTIALYQPIHIMNEWARYSEAIDELMLAWSASASHTSFDRSAISRLMTKACLCYIVFRKTYK